MTQAQQLANLSQAYTAGALGWRNRFINGGHMINQRGSVSNAANGLSYCGADRWYAWPGGAAVTTNNDWQCPVSLNALHITGAAGNTGVAIGQRIERANIYDMLGKQVTVSGWVLVPVAGQSVAVSVSVPRGNDAYGSGWDTVVPGAWAATNLPAATWTYFSYTFTVPSSCSAGMQVEFGMPAVLAGQHAAMGGMQIEIGSIATPFECRPWGAEAALCMRYFEFAQFLGAQGLCQSGANLTCRWNFAVMKRVAPTIAISSPTYVNMSNARVLGSPYISGCILFADGSGGSAANANFFCDGLANAEL